MCVGTLAKLRTLAFSSGGTALTARQSGTQFKVKHSGSLRMRADKFHFQVHQYVRISRQWIPHHSCTSAAVCKQETCLRADGKKIPCEEIYRIKAAQQVLPQLRRCHLALWPGLIWLGSACSLRSVCVCHRCLSRTCITPGKKQVESLTRHHLHLQVAICDVPFRVPACNGRLQYSVHWFKLSGVLFLLLFFCFLKKGLILGNARDILVPFENGHA